MKKITPLLIAVSFMGLLIVGCTKQNITNQEETASTIPKVLLPGTDSSYTLPNGLVVTRVKSTYSDSQLNSMGFKLCGSSDPQIVNNNILKAVNANVGVIAENKPPLPTRSKPLYVTGDILNKIDPNYTDYKFLCQRVNAFTQSPLNPDEISINDFVASDGSGHVNVSNLYHFHSYAFFNKVDGETKTTYTGLKPYPSVPTFYIDNEALSFLGHS